MSKETTKNEAVYDFKETALAFFSDVLTNRIDFVGIVTVDGANPNGDPSGEGLPRQDTRGYGELARILFPTKSKDEPASLNDKARALCQSFRDVRSFGYVLALKGKEEGSKGLSVGVRGPVTITTAKSVQTIQPITVGITKCISNSEMDRNKRGSDTMGKKYRVDGSAYVFKGSISAIQAAKTGFSEADAEALKDAIIHIFDGDESASRPAGSMSLRSLYWFKHNNKLGQYPVQRVHESVRVVPCEDFPFYHEELNLSLISGLEVEEYHIDV